MLDLKDLKKLTVNYVLEAVAQKYADRPAVIFEAETVTYKTLQKYVYGLALCLQKLGVKKDDKVAVILPNCLEYLYIYFALFKCGAWIVPVSTRYEPDEIERVLLNSDASTIIYQDRIGIFDYNTILGEKKSKLPLLKNFIVLGEQKLPEAIFWEDLNYNKIDNPEAEFIPVDVEPDDVAIMGYTSGTTGHPKGVMMMHGNLVTLSNYCGQIMNLDEDVSFSIAPLYAAQGFNAVLVMFVSGITMKWISNFNPNTIITHVVKENVTQFHTQPTMWMLLLSLPYYKHISFSHLNKVIVSGSLCSYNLAKRIEESTKCTLMNVYGIIEHSGLVSATRLDDPEDVRLNTVGRPFPGVQVKIVDSERREVKKGEVGEIAVKGYIMKGYYKNEAKTREVIDDEGWLYTGDLGCYYQDGVNICIVGRCKDMVIRGAFNVYPIDIEECLLNFDKIDDVSVVGKPDDILGESLVAFVIPKHGESITGGEVMQFCRGKIANYKVPDEVIFVSQFPILESGKIQKNVLQRWAVEGVPMDSRMLFDGKLMKDLT